MDYTAGKATAWGPRCPIICTKKGKCADLFLSISIYIFIHERLQRQSFVLQGENITFMVRDYVSIVFIHLYGCFLFLSLLFISILYIQLTLGQQAFELRMGFFSIKTIRYCKLSFPNDSLKGHFLSSSFLYGKTTVYNTDNIQSCVLTGYVISEASSPQQAMSSYILRESKVIRGFSTYRGFVPWPQYCSRINSIYLYVNKISPKEVI